MPLLLLHGWPGSVVEFLDIIPGLAKPEKVRGEGAEQALGEAHHHLLPKGKGAFHGVASSPPGYGWSEGAFHVVAPSLPGYGWSEAPREVGGRGGGGGGDPAAKPASAPSHVPPFLRRA